MILEENYNEGKRSGLSKSYLEETGQMISKGYYKDGKKDGKWTYYYDTGQIREEQNYKDGIVIRNMFWDRDDNITE